MHRFFVPPKTLGQEQIDLPEEVVHHLGKVLRIGVGQIVLLLDGLGEVCLCRIEQLDKRRGLASVLERWNEPETAWPIDLLQALPKGDKLDLVLQKGTELGITTFTPLVSGRSIPRLDEQREAKRRQRWERIIQEAARQCRRPRLPQLSPVQELEKALGGCSAELKVMLWEGDCPPLSEVLGTTRPESAAILVGPEGGFSCQEADTARQSGFTPVSLGPRILRTETAGLAVASILQYIFGDLGIAPGRSKPGPQP